MVLPFWIWPQPIRRQCFSIRRLSATLSPSCVQTGLVSTTLARSFSLIPRILPPAAVEPMFTMRISPFFNFDTLPALESPSILTPNNRLPSLGVVPGATLHLVQGDGILGVLSEPEL